MKIRKNALILIVLFVIIVLSSLICLKRVLLKLKEETYAKVAIVIDDWGYNLRYLNLLKQIDVPITISILPNLRYSSKIAEQVRLQGKEVILHLPLEPQRKGREIRLEEHTIISEMSRDEIIKNLKLALASVPFARGVSNHMGSRATSNIQLMSTIFSELRKKGMFFLDNLVTDKSVCAELAKKSKIKFTQRDFFLDNSDNYEYIKEQIKKLTEFAHELGYAVGIGHARLTTLKALKDTIPSIQAEGIKFVFVSDLAK